MTTLPLSQLDRPLAGADFKRYSVALSQLQGNIFKSHGRPAAVHIFLTFHKGSSDQAKRFLSRLAPRLTSAAEQRCQPKHSSELFTAVYLSARGYEYLGYPQGRFSNEFWNGMRAARLGDPPPDEWEPHYQHEIHAMVLFAHEHGAKLNSPVEQLRAKLEGIADVTAERGQTINEPKVVEHFGYRDGISQPLFYESDLKRKPTRNWNPGAGPKLVLITDPHGFSDDDCGTYLVFRKLEQNVKGFRKHVQKLAALQANGGGPELAGAMVIGRFQDGSPLASRRNQKIGPENDFRYSKSDPQGNRCPFFAHIRKTNPRGESGTVDEKGHRIARRGITYGEATPANSPVEELPETGVGLLFQCCQADLGKQFEFLQKQWASNNNRPKAGAGKDPLIGQSTNGFRRLEFPSTLGSADRTPFSFHSFVTLKGGEYFFAPSISFLRGLA